MQVDPLMVRFTHSKIRNRFSGNSKLIMDTYNDLKSGLVKIEELPQIQIFIINDEMYSMNNRRLYLFKMLAREGFLKTVEVRVGRPNLKQLEKLTPENCALEAKMSMH